VSDQEISDTEAATKARIEQAVQSALGAPYPDPAEEKASEFAS